MIKSSHVEKLRKGLQQHETTLPELFDALSDPSRYRIVLLLLENTDLCVTDVSHILGISVPAVSQQFKILEHAGIVARERRGQMACYCVATGNPAVKSLVKLMTEKR